MLGTALLFFPHKNDVKAFRFTGFSFDEAYERARTILTDYHEEPDDFRIHNIAEFVENIKLIGTVLAILLAAIASISLVIDSSTCFMTIFLASSLENPEIFSSFSSCSFKTPSVFSSNA